MDKEYGMEEKMRVFGLLFAVGCLVRSACGGMPSIGICAHRGDNLAFPENTVPAFTNAVALGAAMIEMDIKRCQTGELIVMHDASVDRTTDGTGNVADLTFAQIRALDTGGGIQVPTFDEAIDCLPTNIWINLHCADNVCAEVATKIQEKGRLHQAFIAATLSGIALARTSVASVLTCNMSRTATGTNWTYAESDQYATDTITNNCNFIQLISDCDTAIYTKLKNAGIRINFFHFENSSDILPFYQKGGEFILTDSLATMVEAANGLAGTNALEYAYRKGSTKNLQWDETCNWVMHKGDHYQVYAVPTANNDTYLWADTLQKNPLHLSAGVNAVTKAFSVGHSSGSGRHILFEFDGGTLTNYGNTAIGDGGTSRGTVNFHDGYWETMGNFNVGKSEALNRITIDTSATLVATRGEFRVAAYASGPGGIVTNNGTIVAYDVFPGESGTGVVECAGSMTIGRKLTIGRNAKASGYFHLCEGGTLTKSDGTVIHAGYSGDGTLVLDETPNFTKLVELSAARNASSKGKIILNKQASPSKISSINLAYGESSSAVMEMNDQSYLNNIDSICVGIGTNSTATLALNDDSLISNVRTVKVASASGSVADLQFNGNGTLSNTIYVAVGTAKGATGTLRMQGGTLTIKDGDGGYYPLLVGSNESTGKIRGWGTIARMNPSNTKAIRIDLWGQVIADGEGEERDLNCGMIRTVGYETTSSNLCGTNGWYAVNKGRLFLPYHQEKSRSTEGISIGEHPWKKSPDLINSFRLNLTKNGSELGSGKYTHAALYATDRSDIPGNRPWGGSAKVLAVYRIGHCEDKMIPEPTNPVEFDTASLSFRFDDTRVEEREYVYLYRHDGTSWRNVGYAHYGDIYVSTATPQPSVAGNWNIGWYAVVAMKPSGTILFIR